MNNIQTQAVRPSATVTATESGTAAVDVSAFHGIGKLVLDSSAMGSAGNSVVKLQDSADGSTNWTDVTGAAFAAVTAAAASHQEITLNTDKLRKFVRVVNTITGGATTQAYGVQLVGKKQST